MHPPDLNATLFLVTLAPPFLSLIVLLAAATLVAGIVLIIRGRPRGLDQGVEACAKCGYILHEAADERCPECGRDVSDPKHRRRGRGPFTRSFRWGVLLCGLAVGLPVGAVLVDTIDWQSMKPVSWLVHDVERGGGRSVAARAELERRLDLGQLTAAEIATILDGRLPPDPPVPGWTPDPAWSHFIVRAWTLGEVDRDDMRRWTRTAFPPPYLVLPEAAAAGYPFNIEIHAGAPVAGPQVVHRNPDFTVIRRARDARIGDQPPDVGTATITNGFFAGRLDTVATIPNLSLEPGQYPISVVIDTFVLEGPPSVWMGVPEIDPNTAFLAFAVTATSIMTIVEPDEALDAIRLESDPAALAELRSRLAPLELNMVTDRYIYPTFDPQASSPVPVAFEIYLQTDKGEYRLGGVTGGPSGIEFQPIGIDNLDVSITRGDLIFTPNPARGLGSPFVSDVMWGDEIVFEDFEIIDARSDR